MAADLLDALPARRGHFALESGYHTDVWLSLDALFASPRDLRPLVAALAGRVRTHRADAVCGPLLGGAFLAHAIAMDLDVDFSFTEPVAESGSRDLFAVEYRLREELARRLKGRRVAVVDDAISAGSSVRATVDALAAVGASTVVVGTLLLLGTAALDHFTRAGIPVEAISRRDLTLWPPATCPLCRAGEPLEDSRRAG